MNFYKNEIGILGGGRWGTALGKKLSSISRVKLYSRDLDAPFKKIDGLEYYQKIEGIGKCNLIIIAVPSFAIREVMNIFKPFYSGQPILGVSKGIEKETGFFPSQIVEEVLGRVIYAHLSGPSFAVEVSKNLPVVNTLGVADLNQSKYFSEILNLKDFKIQLSDDLIGVQVGGALKNILAIAGGMSDGLGYGESFRAMLVSIALKEMILFGQKLGAKRETFLGPAGLGDLILTATSTQSRNYKIGLELGRKPEAVKLEELEILKKETVEGVETVYAVFHLTQKMDLRLPIIEGVYKVIYENKPSRKVLAELKEIL